MAKQTAGYIYVLTSPNSDCIKIGKTEYPPLKRIKEINSDEPYKSFGPWSLFDFRQVSDINQIESNLHYTFRSSLNKIIRGQKELFEAPPHKAANLLNQINPNLLINKPKVDRLFQDEEFSNYLLNFFKFTGLMNWLDIQGAWVFSLFPATGWGRYFTINIGRHEVAFTTLPLTPEEDTLAHMILMDNLIYDFKDVARWVKKKEGSMHKDAYKSALPRSTAVTFFGTFDDANEFLELDGVRRALIAYWSDSLIQMKEKGSQSLFAKSHNWNAIAGLQKRLILK
ncbi:GIY-YIG nuclease family protein [Chloroflexota bacterium]